MSTFKTGLLMLAIFLIFIGIGYYVGGTAGMIIAFILAFLLNIFSYWFSDSIVLAMSRAHELPPEAAPRLHRMVEDLSRAAGIPKPRVYVIEDTGPNAFATGRSPSHSAVAVTTGILRLLTEEELRGVLAHEIAHIANRDILIQTIAATIGGAITVLAHLAPLFMGGRNDDDGPNPIAVLILAILAPIAAFFIQMAISRSREYAADRTGARFAGNPLPLASALRQLTRGNQLRPTHADPATAHMYIVSPLTGGGIASLFSTHPPIEERVRRLEAMAR
jgi:heat shock protein HtpX